MIFHFIMESQVRVGTNNQMSSDHAGPIRKLCHVNGTSSRSVSMSLQEADVVERCDANTSHHQGKRE